MIVGGKKRRGETNAASAHNHPPAAAEDSVVHRLCRHGMDKCPRAGCFCQSEKRRNRLPLE